MSGRSRPGHCPRLLQVVPSQRGCACDEDCPAQHKCCVFDCGALCVPPAFGVKLLFSRLVFPVQSSENGHEHVLVSPSSPQINQGSVPRITGGWECALNSAPTTATVPAVTSAAPTAAVISAPRRTQVRAAARTLGRSSKRAGSLLFLSPAVKPGRCGAPKGTSMCAEFCSHDGDCPGEQKCCRTTCGHACSEPC